MAATRDAQLRRLVAELEALRIRQDEMYRSQLKRDSLWEQWREAKDAHEQAVQDKLAQDEVVNALLAECYVHLAELQRVGLAEPTPEPTS